MKVSPMGITAMTPLADPRRGRTAARPAPLAALGPKLPGVVAERLAGLMAQDPGLAEAVSARLPEARAESARDLAAYTSVGPISTIDIRS